jgi:hypothetical protein
MAFELAKEFNTDKKGISEDAHRWIRAVERFRVESNAVMRRTRFSDCHWEADRGHDDREPQGHSCFARESRWLNLAPPFITSNAASASLIPACVSDA